MKKNNNSLKRSKDKMLIIHYSCENLNDSVDGYSPRITSIVVKNLFSRISHSFSIHLEADISKIDKKNITKHYDTLEKAMLQNFYKFVSNHLTHYWLHWNMRNIHYGFETLEHRFKVNGAKQEDISSIPDDKRLNLSDLITDAYGNDCVSHPRMQKLMELNGGEPKGFLPGKNEVQAFKKEEYIKLHESTLSKVGWFGEMLDLLINNKIKTEKSNIGMHIKRIFDSSGARSITFIIAIISLVLNVVQWIK